MFLLTLLLTLNSAFVPYLDTDFAFHMNRTGARVGGEPLIAFTCVTDELNLDSLSTLYPTVITLSEEQFEDLIEQPEVFCERFGGE